MQLASIFNQHKKLSNSDYSNFDHSKVLPRHRWYYFKEGFSPLLVEEAINYAGVTSDDLIVDPFSGSGTVALVSNSLNKKSVVFEVNPFMAFVANTKLTEVKSSQFSQYFNLVHRGINKGEYSKLESFSTFTEGQNKKKWLFNIDVLRAFEGGWSVADKLPAEIGKLYKLSLISSIMTNCNAVKDGKCLRYKKNWRLLNYSKENFITEFEKQFAIINEDLSKTILNNSKVFIGDVRKKVNKLDSSSFKLCITSPPYLNSFDYSDIYRPELFLGKFVKNNDELLKLRLRTLRSHIQVSWESPTRSNFGLLYQNCFNEILKRKELLWNKRIPTMIQAYFEDMEMLLNNLKHKAHRDASLWIVVSTSAYAGIEIPVDLILADIGSNIGWNLEEIIVTRQLRNSTQNAKKWNDGSGSSKRLRESIVVFRGVNK